jgi:hypothetical protein
MKSAPAGPQLQQQQQQRDAAAAPTCARYPSRLIAFLTIALLLVSFHPLLPYITTSREKLSGYKYLN